MQSSGFPNFHIVGTIAQASQSFNYPQVTASQTLQAARLAARCLRQNVRTFEVTPEAEQRWAAEMADKANDGSAFEAECTPGYYNNEGKKGPGAALFGSMYGGGPIEYISQLDRWFDSDFSNDVNIQYEDA